MRPWFALSLAILSMGCSKRDADGVRNEAPPARSEQPSSIVVGSSIEAGVPASAPAATVDARPAWQRFLQKDLVPLCVFPSDEARIQAPFLKDVKKQSLRPGSTLVFGAFAPGCASEECITRPTLQCWAELDGEQIVVHSRYSGEQAVGRVCTDKCEPVTAGCPLPELRAGTYTVRYGDRTMALKIPSTLRSPCVSAE